MAEGTQTSLFHSASSTSGTEALATSMGDVRAPSIVVVIPGEPCAQGRGRAFAYRAKATGQLRVAVHDPAKSRDWKAMAHDHFTQAMAGRPPFAGPIELQVIAYFTCPRSHWKVRTPVPERPKISKPDIDNIYKICADSGNGILWLDDAQIWGARITKHIAAQGAAPRVIVRVWAMGAHG